MALRNLIRRASFCAGILLWAASIFWGGRMLLNYENAPGARGNPPPTWPSESRIVRPRNRFFLVMFLHPDCPCSQASVTELARLMAKLQGHLASAVVFGRPASDERSVRAGSLWKRVAAIPEIAELYDEQGIEIGHFGGWTSGEAMLFDLDGRLLFHGGMTSARGHEGDNAGSDAIIRLVRGESRAMANTAVFGCSLRNPGAQNLQEEPAWRKQ